VQATPKPAASAGTADATIQSESDGHAALKAQTKNAKNAQATYSTPEKVNAKSKTEQIARKTAAAARNAREAPARQPTKEENAAQNSIKNAVNAIAVPATQAVSTVTHVVQRVKAETADSVI
jgi:hypothetical protein